MITHQAQDKSRTATSRTWVRRAVIAFAIGLVALVSLPVSAIADTPEAWDDAPHVSGLQFLVVLVLLPVAAFVVIALLAALPSMIRDKGYEPGQSWRSEPEWFGGPRKGVESAEDLTEKQIEAAEADRGGTSGKW